VNLIVSITLTLTILYGLTICAVLIGMLSREFGTHKTQEKVTVIIAARNEEQNIGNILEDLSRQNYPSNLFEVIVANDHSTDNTAQIVRQLAADHPQIKLLDMGEIPKNFSPKKFAIQSAVQQSMGDIILATDADCRVGKDWIKSMVSYFEGDIGFVIGFSQFGALGEKQNLIERLQAFDFATMMGVAVGSTNLGIHLAASGQNLGYRKVAFEEIGGYKKVAHRVSGDDVLLLQLVRKYTQHKIVFAGDPRTFAVSQPQPTLKDFINQRKRWASNGGYQLRLNFVFFLFLLQVLLFNASLFVGLFAAALSGEYMLTMLGFVGARIFFEFVIAVRSAFYFDRTDLLKYFPMWFIVQIPYIVGVGLAGTFGKFQWKERLHAAEIKHGESVES
jgi:cellulose synthase/poly-beta-1,6-N-acetylglucosamine synthase-like glycosyltransferase